MPESVTAITVVGRPVVTSQAASTLLPSTPHNSCGLSASSVTLDRALVSFSLPPPLSQLAGRSGYSCDGVCGFSTHLCSDTPSGAAGHGNSPVCDAVPEPVFGSPLSAGHDAGRASTI